MEMWLLHLAALEEHERWARGERQGSRGIVLENEDLKNAVLPVLTWQRHDLWDVILVKQTSGLGS
jgi:hypothetical protein